MESLILRHGHDWQPSFHTGAKARPTKRSSCTKIPKSYRYKRWIFYSGGAPKVRLFDWSGLRISAVGKHRRPIRRLNSPNQVQDMPRLKWMHQDPWMTGASTRAFILTLKCGL